MSKNGIRVSERTIRRWIDAYADLMERFASTLRHIVGNRWSLDEKMVKTHPASSKQQAGSGRRWLAAALDNQTGLVMSHEVSGTKSGYYTTRLLESAISLTGRVPSMVLADGLNGYKKRFENAVKSRNPAVVLVANVGINGRYVSNNRRERLNGEIGECLFRARGFRSAIPGLVRLIIVYHNFIHRSGGPAEPSRPRPPGWLLPVWTSS